MARGSWILLAALGLAGCQSEELGEGRWLGNTCRDPDGYTIYEYVEYLRPERFTEAALARRYRDLDAELKSEELYAISYSDPELRKELSVPKVGTLGGWPPLSWKGPAARFFRIGQNAFFEYSDAEGRIHRVVLEGRNILTGEVLPGIRVTFASQRFGFLPPADRRREWHEAVREGRPWVLRCQDGWRRLVFVVHDWDREKVKKLADFYDTIFAVPPALDILFCPSWEIAAHYGSITWPSLEGNAAGLTQLAMRPLPETEYDKSTFSFSRLREGRRLVNREFREWTPWKGAE